MWKEGRKDVFYLTTHSTHFIYGYMASDIWLRTIQIVRKETRCRHIGYSFRLTERVLLYAQSHIQDSTYHSLCYTSRGALAGTRNSPMKDRSDDSSHHERTLLPRSYISLPQLCGSLALRSEGARCSSVVRAFAHGAMGRRIDPSWYGPTELFLVPACAPLLF